MCTLKWADEKVKILKDIYSSNSNLIQYQDSPFR